MTTHRTPHFTPVGSSWINQIETWLGIITRQSIRRGTFTSVKGHCCIKAKGVLAVPQSGDAGPSDTLENRNKPGI